MGMQTGTYTSGADTPFKCIKRNFYTVFASTYIASYTGNTVFLALITASLPENAPYLSWVRALLSIVSFMVGAYVSSRLLNQFGLTRRLTLAFNFFVQGLFIFIAGILVATDVIPPLRQDATSQRILLAIPFLAAQFGAQVATAKGLGVVEVPTTMVSNVYSDLVSDRNWLKRDNIKRDRRVGVAVSFLLGGISGAWLVREGQGVENVLWVGGGVKMGLTCCWLVFPGVGESLGENNC